MEDGSSLEEQEWQGCDKVTACPMHQEWVALGWIWIMKELPSNQKARRKCRAPSGFIFQTRKCLFRSHICKANVEKYNISAASVE